MTSPMKPGSAELHAADVVARVVDDADHVGEAAHVVVVPLGRRAPLDAHDVLGRVGEPANRRRRHRAVAEAAVSEPPRVVDEHPDVDRLGDVAEVADHVVLGRVVEDRQVDLETDRAQVLRPFRVVDRLERGLRLEGAEDRRPAGRGLHDGVEEPWPLVVGQVGAFAHRRRHLEDRPTRRQPLVDPPVGHAGHRRQIDGEVAVERGRQRGERSAGDGEQAGAIHVTPWSAARRHSLSVHRCRDHAGSCSHGTHSVPSHQRCQSCPSRPGAKTSSRSGPHDDAAGPPASSPPSVSQSCQLSAVPVAIPQLAVVEHGEDLHPVDRPRRHGRPERHPTAEGFGRQPRRRGPRPGARRRVPRRPRTGRSGLVPRKRPSSHRWLVP